MAAPGPSRAVKIAGWSALALFLFVCAEILAWAALTVAGPLPNLVYRAPEVTEAEYAAYLEARDPALGWPSRGWLEDNADARGARNSPANAALGDTAPCVSLYGDSFTFSDEVGDADAWGDVMARELGCRVDSYGVGGFGVAQAVLRFEGHVEEGRDVGRVVILSIYPDNLNRMVNQWRYLLSGRPLVFKPGVVIGDGGPRIAPLFSGDYDDLQQVFRDPSVLAGEAYLPDSYMIHRRARIGFPYSFSLIRVGLRFFRAWRGYDSSVPMNFANYPAYYDTPEGPSEFKRQALAFLLARFDAACDRAGALCAVMLIPDPELLYQRDRSGAHDLGWLLDSAPGSLRRFDASDIFAGLDDICGMVSSQPDCKGHFTPEGYRRLAAFVLSQIGDAAAGR